MKIKEFLAMDNIVGKTIIVTEERISYKIKIPSDPQEAFKLNHGKIILYHDFLNSECEILETTVEDFLNRIHPDIVYGHRTTKCGWNKYHICLDFESCRICIDSEDKKQLEQEVCRAINQKFNLDLEPSNLDFLK